MAKDDEQKNLLARLSNKVPADRKPSEPAIREPREPSKAAKADREPTPKGKTPEEVLGEAAERQVQPVEAVEEPTPPERKWKIRDEELTLDQIAERGLMDALVTTHEQHKYLQEKYEKTLEKIAEKATEARTPQVTEPPPVVRPTPKQILDAFTPRMVRCAQEGYIEPELPEAYPLLITNLMYFADIIETLAQEMHQMKEWIRSEVTLRNARTIEQALNKAVDEVAGMDGKLYEALKKPEHRKKFIDWLYKEVDPSVSLGVPNPPELTAERIRTHYLSFSSDVLFELAKHTSEKEPPAPKPRLRGEGTGAGVGAPEPPPEPKGLLKRLTETRLGPRD